jgi:hypothetical protein
MDGSLLAKLRPDTQLILGDVAATVSEFVKRQSAPAGFVAFDLDLYSSTRAGAASNRLPPFPKARGWTRCIWRMI